MIEGLDSLFILIEGVCVMVDVLLYKLGARHQRLLIDKTDLTMKIQYLNSSLGDDLPPDERNLLVKQLKVMEEYSGILQEREKAMVVLLAGAE